jgi:hypothetical protein
MIVDRDSIGGMQGRQYRAERVNDEPAGRRRIEE